MRKQLSLFKPISKEFGGSLLVGKRKTKRVLTTKNPIHMTIKGDVEKSGSLIKHANKLNREIRRLGEKFEIRIYDFAIEKNHIHFVLRISSRENYSRFIRALTGRIAQLLNFKFTLRPFTKIIEWGRQFKSALNYLLQNKHEAWGLKPYKTRLYQKRQNRMALENWIEEASQRWALPHS